MKLWALGFGTSAPMMDDTAESLESGAQNL